MAQSRSGGVGKILALLLLLLSSVFAILVLGFATWLVEKEGYGTPYVPVTSDFIRFSLIAGVVAVASYIVGLHHIRLWTLPSAAAAQAAAWIALLLLMLPFASAWKEVHYWQNDGKVIALESFVIVLTALHFAYTLLLYLPDR